MISLNPSIAASQDKGKIPSVSHINNTTKNRPLVASAVSFLSNTLISILCSSHNHPHAKERRYVPISYLCGTTMFKLKVFIFTSLFVFLMLVYD
jgi:hypothetical protein